MISTARLSSEPWGALPGGDPVRLYTLRNAHGMKVAISDLGATLEKCAARVRAALDAGPYPDLGLLFKACAQGCARASGSSFGTLLTVAFLTLARRLENQAALAWRDVPEMLQAALDAMAQRGGAKLGDKTVLDALAAAQAAIVGLDEPHAQHAAASAAVEATIASFREKPTRIGRARMFAER